MPVEEKSAALMIELLSLEHGQDGYRMEVGLTRSGAFTRQMVHIDELTYLQMNALPLLKDSGFGCHCTRSGIPSARHISAHLSK